MNWPRKALVLAALLCSLGTHAALKESEIPEPLRPWAPWVLYGEEDRFCPFLYNVQAERLCAWPSRLHLAVDATGGRFVQHWEVFRAGWVPLPGDARRWPQAVQLDDSEGLVADRAGTPSLWLTPGNHTVRGNFEWRRLPDTLQIPAATGLVGLTVGGTTVPFPALDDNGRLWLVERTGPVTATGLSDERLEIQVFRRIVDEIPLKVITRLDIDVSGTAREVIIDGVLLSELIPLRLSSPIPARLEPNGALRLQVRAGHWQIELDARHPAQITRLSFPDPPVAGVDGEIWVFDARNALRLVEVQGVSPVDPRQTMLPQAWRHLPAYRLGPGETMQLEVKRRGDPEPAPDRLNLSRLLWLDFDGKGFSIRDTVTGSMTQGWRLETAPEISLGRVAIDGQDQFITRLPDADREGVEVRRGAINLIADSRFEAEVANLPAVGWAQDFQQVSAVLNLPPGWKLFSASGADRVTHTWIQRWTLLDLFLVLIAALATRRLWGWPWGLLALAALALTWHEPGAPRYVWLHLLAAIALLRVAPAGRFHHAVRWYRNASLAGLLIIGVPYLVETVRVGLYPQLERPWAVSRQVSPMTAPLSFESKMVEDVTSQGLESLAPDRLRKAAPSDTPDGALSSIADLAQFDPRAKVQTGPGLPEWQWTSISLDWNGPVERDQRVHLILLSPAANLALNLLRVALVALLAGCMIGAPLRNLRLRTGMGTAALAVIGLTLFTALPNDAAAELPSEDMLRTLKERLLAPAECLPTCAHSPRLYISINRDFIEMRMVIHASDKVAVPLPAHARQWLPQQVTVDDQPSPELSRAPGGTLLLHLVPGIHQVLLSGRTPSRDQFQLSLPLHPAVVDVTAQGWIVEGVNEDGTVAGQLQFSRETSTPQATLPALEPLALPPFLRVERTLRLGLDWRVHTRVERVSPPGTAIVTTVPLLEGESVITDGIQVRDGAAQINMAPLQMEIQWQSVLDKRPVVVLRAPDTTGAVELWRADISPVWHAQTEGLAVIHHQDASGRWLPEWRPWPGEQVSIAVTRPEGVAGRTLTFDGTHLDLRPGRRATDAALRVIARSSEGGQHTLLLPPTANLLSVTIDGTAQPVRQEGQHVTLPLTPGRHVWDLVWREPVGISGLFTTPAASLAAPSVNTDIELFLPQNRWVLFVGGPRLGAAVLFWGVLAVIILLALALGRTRVVPLKTHHWFLLGIGLSQTPVWAALIVVGWFFALAARERLEEDVSKLAFNSIQIGLGFLTVVALSCLFFAIQRGLLGLPEMQIAGNGSSALRLLWYQDRAGIELPQAWVVSVPLFVYRLLMLAWALWLAFALLRWLRWGWYCFSKNGLWRTLRLAKAGQARDSGGETPPG